VKVELIHASNYEFHLKSQQAVTNQAFGKQKCQTPEKNTEDWLTRILMWLEQVLMQTLIIIIIIYHLYAGYLQLFNCNKLCF